MSVADMNLDEEFAMDMSELPPLPSMNKNVTGTGTGVGGNRATFLASTSPIMKRGASSSSKIASPALSVTSESPSGSAAPSPGGRDIYSSGGLEFPVTEVSIAGGGIVELSPVLSFLRDEPQQMSLQFVLPRNEMEEGDEEEAEHEDDQNEEEDEEGGRSARRSRLSSARSESVDFSVSIDSSMNKYDFGTNVLISTRLQKFCKKLLNQKRLAEDVGVTDKFAAAVLRPLAKLDSSGEDVMYVASSDDETKGHVDHHHDHAHHHSHQQNPNHSTMDQTNQLNELVGGNMTIMPQSSDEMSVTGSICSDVNCQHHDVNGELNEEVCIEFFLDDYKFLLSFHII